MKSTIDQATVIQFQENKKFLIYSVSKTDFVSIATEPFIWLDYKNSFEEVAEKVIYALNHSKSGLKAPKDWKKHLVNFLTKLGFSKERELYYKTMYVGVLRKNDTIFLTPMKNTGKGVVNVPNIVFEIPGNKSISEIARVLQSAFDKCE